MTQLISKAIRDFSGLNILVVGDLMLDEYQQGSVARISPEAPVPIVSIDKVNWILGGAGNVLTNLQGIGARPIPLGFLGVDEGGSFISDYLESKNVNTTYVTTLPGYATMRKVRIIAGNNQQVVRLDYENTELSKDIHNKIYDYLYMIITNLPEVDVVIISDYAKGVFNASVLKMIVDSFNEKNIPIIVDSKSFSWGVFAGVKVVTSNLKEVCFVTNEKINIRDSLKIIEVGTKLLNKHVFDALAITCGEEGIWLLQKSKEAVHYSSKVLEVFDVSGAGDTVTAIIGTAVGAGWCLEDAVCFANYCAGIVVGKTRTHPITIKDLQESIN